MNLQQQFEEKQKQLAALLALGDAITEEQVTQASTLADECEALKTRIEAQAALQARASSLTAWQNTPVLPVPFAGGPSPAPVTTVMTPTGRESAESFTIPATAYRSRVTSFQDDKRFSAHEKAYRFGRFISATIGGNRQSQQWCMGHGIPLMKMHGDQSINLVHTEEVNSQGGFLVAPEFDWDLIVLRERYGVFRANSRTVPMNSETKLVPRRDTGLTAYWLGEADSITASTMGWSQINLVAKKLGVLAYLSSELNEDSYIDVGNELADEIAWAFAKMEDDCGFSGDGTSTYGGITGIRNALLNLSTTRANIAGLFVGSGNLWSELVLADFNQVVGRLPQYADTARAAWYVHKTFYHTVMERLSLAAGGVTAAEIAGGQREFRFMGYPVRIAQAMPGVEANDVVCAILGDLSLGTRFGDRRMTTIALSEHTAFTSDQLAIRGIERFDIVVHDVGNAHATASSRVPGPICGLLTAAS